MKKIFTLILALALAMSLAVCASAETLEEAIANAQTMTNEELYAKALTEGGIKVYSTTSRSATAAENFMALYPGLTVADSNVSEADMISKLAYEIESNNGPDLVLMQNTYQMEATFASEGLIFNYFPASMADVVAEADRNPCVITHCNKLIIFNNKGGDIGLKNVWQLTEADFPGTVFFKDPTSETVGMNFLMMLTKDEWNTALEEAYQDYYGKAWEATGEFEKCALEWIDGFLSKCNYTYTSDTDISANVAAGNAGNVGLYVFSKFRKTEGKEFLTLACNASDELGYWDEKGLNCFSGFIYPICAQVCLNSDAPYTSALFINYLLTAEGSNPWTKDMGNYSPNTTIAIAGNDGDHDIAYWRDTLVVEDGAYIATVYADYIDFILERIG